MRAAAVRRDAKEELDDEHGEERVVQRVQRVQRLAVPGDHLRVRLQREHDRARDDHDEDEGVERVRLHDLAQPGDHRRDDTLCAMSAEDSLRRAEELLTRVEEARARLETTDDPDAALDVLADLAELAKQVEGEIQRAKREAEAEADAER